MSSRPDERRTAHAYDHWLAERSPSGALRRLLTGTAATYLVNTPLFTIPDLVGLQPDHLVLDLGCGHGSLAGLIAQHSGLKRDPVGVDISLSMLRLSARDRGSSRRVRPVAAAATRLPFPDATFHLVIGAYLFKHLEDETLFRTLLEANRVLKPGGILLAWEFAPTSSRLLNRFHRWLLTPRVKSFNLRGFGALAPYALYGGFQHVDRVRFPLPFLFPPIPRVVVMLQKARDAIAAPPANFAHAQQLWQRDAAASTQANGDRP